MSTDSPGTPLGGKMSSRNLAALAALWAILTIMGETPMAPLAGALAAAVALSVTIWYGEAAADNLGKVI